MFDEIGGLPDQGNTLCALRFDVRPIEIAFAGECDLLCARTSVFPVNCQRQGCRLVDPISRLGLCQLALRACAVDQQVECLQSMCHCFGAVTLRSTQRGIRAALGFAESLRDEQRMHIIAHCCVSAQRGQ